MKNNPNFSGNSREGQENTKVSFPSNALIVEK
jgi:hypothetical protein